MAKWISADDLQGIAGCWMQYAKKHMFCVDCLERKGFEKSSCRLCRPFHALPDEGLDGYPRKLCMEKLVDLHQLYGRENQDVIGENIFDIPLAERFKIRRVTDQKVEIAWLENKIYVAYSGIKRVRVFANHAPYNELPEAIEINESYFTPCGMVASSFTRSLFISDSLRCTVWKIRLSNNKLTRIHVCFLPAHLSITPDDELLAVVVDENWKRRNPNRISFCLDFFRQSDFSRTKSVPVPSEVFQISCAAQLPNKSIIISYATNHERTEYWISILSTDGDAIHNFDPDVFESIRRNPWCPEYFAIRENGDIFFTDCLNDRVFLFNSQLTDYQLISYNNERLQCPHKMVYMKDRGQLLVNEYVELGYDCVPHLSVLHLGPCNLIQRRNDEEERPAWRILKRKRKTFDFTSKYHKIRLQKMKRLSHLAD